MVYCHIVPAPDDDDDGVVEVIVQKFYVLDRSLRNNFRTEFTYKVKYRADGEHLNCQCHRFEFRGLLCYHILTVMTMKDICSINERYILTRWRKDVFRRHSSKSTRDISKLIFFQECVDAVISRSQHMDKLKDNLIELKNEFLSSNTAGVEDQHTSVPEPIDTFEVGGTPIHDPQTTRRKERPRSNRLMPQYEINQRWSRGAKVARRHTTNGNNNMMNDPVVLGDVDISLTL
ncbi:hypothetical protein ACS0TY_006744 [Phlomoides rotata]